MYAILQDERKEISMTDPSTPAAAVAELQAARCCQTFAHNAATWLATACQVCVCVCVCEVYIVFAFAGKRPASLMQLSKSHGTPDLQVLLQ